MNKVYKALCRRLGISQFKMDRVGGGTLDKRVNSEVLPILHKREEGEIATYKN